MSSKVTGWVWDQDLPVSRKCVLLWLAERATDNGVCFPGQAEIRQKTGLSESMVHRRLRGLATGLDEQGQPGQPLVRIIERPVAGARNTSNVYVLLVPWAEPNDVQRGLEELKHMPEGALPGVGCMDAPQGVGCTEYPQWVAPVHPRWVAPAHPRNRHLRTQTGNTPPYPPRRGSSGRGKASRTKRPARSALFDSRSTVPRDDQAEALVRALYAGLGTQPRSVTTTIRRRDLAIARQLVEAGATPAEAEAYAREASSLDGRLAPIDLRSFERERPTWLGRQHRKRVRHVDRTGLPPSWLAPAPKASRAAMAPSGSDPQQRPAGGCPHDRYSLETNADLAGGRLGESLRAALVRGVR